MGPLQDFHFFPHLPAELRLKIWDYALYNPRVLTITCDKGSRRHGTGTRRFAESFTSSSPAPGMLHTNHEARVCALSTYSAYFGASTPIYISFEQDTIRVADGVLAYIPDEVQSEIETLVVEVRQPDQFSAYHFDTLKEITRLTRLDMMVHEAMAYHWSSRLFWEYLKRDFESEKAVYPAWKNLKVVFFDWDTRALLGEAEDKSEDQ